MEDKLRKAIAACKVAHEWAMMELRDQWSADRRYQVKTADLVPGMTRYLSSMLMKEDAQRFSLVAALNRAVACFYQGIRVEMSGGEGERSAKVHFPLPAQPEEYRMVDIQSRAIWKRYLEEHGRISTNYGSIFFEDEWVKALEGQALSIGISFSVIPYLIYSVSIRKKEEQWQAHFNFHHNTSQQGKKRLTQTWQLQS